MSDYEDLSRLGRNAIDTGFYIDKYFPAHSLRFIAINDGYDSADGQSGGLMISLKNMINETFALEIGRKIKNTKQMHIQNGAFVGRFPPYGYLKDAEDNHKLVIDENAAPIILQIYEMAANGTAKRNRLKPSAVFSKSMQNENRPLLDGIRQKKSKNM